LLQDFLDKKPNIDKSAYIAMSAIVCGQVSLAGNVSVWHNASIRGDIAPVEIGVGSNVQENAVIHVIHNVPVKVGENVTIGHGAILHSCSVGDNSLIGMGAIVLDGAVVGKNCLIGAGALVTPGTIIPDGNLVLGSPAKIRRELSVDEITANIQNSKEYVELAKVYRNSPSY